MDTNAFIANLKAHGTEKDLYDLSRSLEEYKGILKNLNTKDKGLFSLNVLCTVIRNIETIPTWGDKINTKDLLTLAIECVRHTRSLDKPEQVKTLACIFRLHKHIVTRKSPSSPELVLKLSFMPFEYDDECLLHEYYKTYGHIIIDRITYIEKLKSTKLPILKLLPKLAEDITKVIKIYDVVHFCTDMLTYIVKKMSYMYNEWPEEINDTIGKIFESLSKNDLKSCKDVSEKQANDLYVKLNECLFTVMENSLKIHFKNSVLDSVTRVCVSILGHKPDMFHCFQTIYLNSLCCIFSDKTSPILIDNLLRNLLTSCEMTEKLGYKDTMYVTYPYISQLLRLYIEHIANSQNKSDSFNESTQENLLKIVKFLLEKLKKSRQLTKCENCSVKSGLHDALRLSFSVKHFIIISTDNNIPLKTNLLIYFTIVEQQYLILEELNKLMCPNHDRCFRKLQIDIHNVAVILNKYQYYEYSIKCFEIYLKYELKLMKTDAELKNITRALYNKSICELDAKCYMEGLLDAYLSLVFSLPDGVNSEKYMGLVIDVKSKALKDDASDESHGLQSMSVLQACAVLYEDKTYGNLKPFLKNVKFSELLKHEFLMYVRLWASVAPICGVWKGLFYLTKKKYHWVKVEKMEILVWTLYEVVLETPTVVRNFQDDCYRHIIAELVDESPDTQVTPTCARALVRGALLLLKSEFDMAEATQRHGWKVAEFTTDPDEDETVRTFQQEHAAIESALLAVQLLSGVTHELQPGVLPPTTLRHMAQISLISVQQLLHLEQFAHALQLAWVGCRIADLAADQESYILHASPLIYHSRQNKQTDSLIARAVKMASRLIGNAQSMDAALCLLCDVAIYYIKSECLYMAAKIVQSVQTTLLVELEKQPEANLDVCVGRLLEAQAQLCPDAGLSTLSDANGLHRHYLAARSTAVRWSQRRAASLHLKSCVVRSGAAATRAARRLALWRRAACSAAATLRAAAAPARARLHAALVNAHDVDAQTKISLHLKSILKSNELHHADVQTPATEHKVEQFTPQQDNVEIMLDSMFHKTPRSPSVALIKVPVFQIPEFLKHAQTCTCYACVTPECMLLACQISHLEASTYFRSKENEIAHNYFEGGLKTFDLAKEKLKNVFKNYKTMKYNDVVIDTVKEMAENELKTIELEFLIELAFFELSRKEFSKSDDCVVAIHEILAGFKNVDAYLKNDVSNLLVASANLRKSKVVKETGLELDMEELKISPRLLKTPESKTMPQIANTVKVVSKEEIHSKLKPVKFKLDILDNEKENSKLEDDQETNTRQETKVRQSKFKVPVPLPAVPKPILEDMTPRPTRSKPKVIITGPNQSETDIGTPKTDQNLEFFTPCESTPAQFFTPITTMKTYSKKRNLIGKNLENDFLTPKPNNDSILDSTKKPDKKDLKSDNQCSKSDGKDSNIVKNDSKSDGHDSKHVKEDAGRRTRSRVETGTIKGLSDKRSLKRATSPGKLVEEKPTSRTRRVK